MLKLQPETSQIKRIIQLGNAIEALDRVGLQFYQQEV